MVKPKPVKKKKLQVTGEKAKDRTQQLRMSLESLLEVSYSDSKEFKRLIARIQDVVRREGANGRFAGNLDPVIERYFENLVQLRSLWHMSLMLGMGPFADRILRNEIDRLFPKPEDRHK